MGNDETVSFSFWWWDSMRTFGLSLLSPVAAIAAAGFLAGAAQATPINLDFDSNVAGEVIDGDINPFVRLTTTGGQGAAVVFDTRNPTGGDEDLILVTNLTPGVNGPSPGGNVLIIAENLIDADMNGLVDIPDDNANGGSFTFDFANEVTFFGFNAIDFTDGGGFLTVDLFGASGNLFSFTIDDVMRSGVDLVADVGDQAFFGLFNNIFGDDGIAGVTQAVITLGGSGAIDGVSFHANEVPVPAALPLMVSTLAFGGFVARRRKLRRTA
ncbi:MAG: hypothetical protein AAGL18_02530 [Pseudomonadota bacterium]